MSSFWLTLKQQWTIKISSPLFSIFSLVAILVGSREHRTQFWKGAIQRPFHQSLVAIGPVVSQEKIKMWNVDGRTTDDGRKVMTKNEEKKQAYKFFLYLCVIEKCTGTTNELLIEILISLKFFRPILIQQIIYGNESKVHFFWSLFVSIQKQCTRKYVMIVNIFVVVQCKLKRTYLSILILYINS